MGWVLLAALSFLCSPAARGDETVIAPDKAGDFIDREAVVERTVAQVRVWRRSETTYLNFGAPYPNETFTAVIFRGNRSLFPKAREWKGKRVRISGEVQLYKGKPEIVLERAWQVTLVP